MRRHLACLLLCALVVTACAETSTSSPSTSAVVVASPSTSADATVTTIAALDPTIDRPFEVIAPATYDGTSSLPLIVLLHGFGITGAMQNDTFDLTSLVETRNFLLVTPDGSRNADGDPFWNATDACCGFGATVDDSTYLAAVIARVQANYSVDPRRISLLGFSNGGFMSYRMACDHADLVASIVSISGATFLDPTMCTPNAPVNVVEIHGTDDEAVPFEGGLFEGTALPGAVQTTTQWAAYNGCGDTPATTDAALDLDESLEGNESSVTQFVGCPADGDVQLWTIPGAGHIPEFSSTFSDQVVDYLLGHPRA
jgi:polyhydroxybutyrate depolymerase